MTQPHVHVYGVDYSPWVQAVLLGLHEKGIPHTLRTIPPLAVSAKSGVMMPAASFGDARWRLESTDILHELGYDRVSPDDLREIYAAWRGVFHRADHISWFFGNFSLCRDPSPSLPARLRNHFLRSFSVLYFYLLIRFTVLSRLQPDPENFADQFVYWEKTLREGKGPFLDGTEPGIRDMLLFGIIQCHCSILVPPAPAMQREARLSSLRVWIGLMHGRFADYPHLYSGVYFEPHAPAPEPSTPAERNVFWLGAAFSARLIVRIMSNRLETGLTAPSRESFKGDRGLTDGPVDITRFGGTPTCSTSTRDFSRSSPGSCS